MIPFLNKNHNKNKLILILFSLCFNSNSFFLLMFYWTCFIFLWFFILVFFSLHFHREWKNIFSFFLLLILFFFLILISSIYVIPSPFTFRIWSICLNTYLIWFNLRGDEWMTENNKKTIYLCNEMAGKRLHHEQKTIEKRKEN